MALGSDGSKLFERQRINLRLFPRIADAMRASSVLGEGAGNPGRSGASGSATVDQRLNASGALAGHTVAPGPVLH
ncbi:hypothetical protein [Rhodobacter sp. NSM]|uniref:hypothetical protein n=1 Tax=Rhodobacter sp. NSM TaxID=3457501 RepID=UPI003FCF8FA7